MVAEAVASGLSLEVLAVREGVDFELPPTAAEREVTLSERAFASISQTVTPQGVLAIASRRLAAVPEAHAAARAAGWPLVVLDGVQDPGNVGTICRTAAAAGVPALVLLGGADPYGPKAVRASAGTIFRLVVARGDGWSELESVPGIGAAASGGTPVAEADLAGAGLIALGGEARGLSRRDLEPVTIPMAPGVESLNVAAAAAILLFEVRRRLAAQ